MNSQKEKRRQELRDAKVGVSAALATDASEAAQGQKQFVLQPTNDSVVLLAFTKNAMEIPAKSLIRVDAAVRVG